MMSRTRYAAVGCMTIAALAAAAAAPLGAKDKDSGDESAYVTALRECQAKTDPAERLACYDTAVAAMVSATSEGEVQVVDREAVRETRRKLFGFTLPDLGIFGGKSDKDDPEQEEEFTTLNTTITGVRGVSGTYVLTTAEGAQWQLDELPARLMKPKIGQTLEIKKGALSSYFLRINGQKGVKGRRVQ
ncbi:hypothetical protein [Erythrobacter sp. BLCC-B19]|uniref:hypothetical protein n=1 Tax=Erythrobacter sp. BLCC-B19 TaxID=3025315 RepID=UPI00235E4E84|nr:hypothetical protein [Erythrobacter sp. BLCC-B19]WDA39885.1 hypothetical protein PS060_09925 [Erythrobacter sp. BLCC-B19]